MKIVIFGLSISSSWGNGHATLWRGLCRALKKRSHEVVFFERDTPYYAANRDLTEVPGATLVLYPNWETVISRAQEEINDADVTIITSYCPDGIAATEAVIDSSTIRVFYDLDTPVTLAAAQQGKALSYIGPRGLCDFDMVLSYTGGQALDAMKQQFGARCVVPLYGSVDPEVHCPVPDIGRFRADLSYLGTYATDRQIMLNRLLLEPAEKLPDQKFLIGGALYPESFPWQKNIYYIQHIAPHDHSAFYCSSRLTLSVTRSSMGAMGYCPSGRLFEAAACGTPVLSDTWEGLNEFFTPESEILIASRANDTMDALSLSDAELRRIGQAARERALSEHTADQRARELEQILERFQSRALDTMKV